MFQSQLPEKNGNLAGNLIVVESEVSSLAPATQLRQKSACVDSTVKQGGLKADFGEVDACVCGEEQV